MNSDFITLTVVHTCIFSYLSFVVKNHLNVVNRQIEMFRTDKTDIEKKRGETLFPYMGEDTG